MFLRTLIFRIFEILVFKIFSNMKIKVVIKKNHQSGRDSHLRRVEILGPREQPKTMNAFEDQWCIMR